MNCKGKKEKFPLEYIDGANIIFECKNNKRTKSYIELEIFDGYTRVYEKAINFKKFYISLHDFFENSRFTDQWEFGKPADPIEKPDKSKTRTHDMYETYFHIAEKDNGKECDIKWKLKSKINNYGVLYIDLNIANRFFTEKNGLQEGKWEIMISAKYQNNIGDKLRDSFLVKYLGWIADWELLAYKYFYREVIESDLNLIENILGSFWREVEKHLT